MVLFVLTGCASSSRWRSPEPSGLRYRPDEIDLAVTTALFRDSGQEGWVIHVHASFPRNRLLFLHEEGPTGLLWRAEYEWRVVVRSGRSTQVGGGVYARSVVLAPGERPEDPGSWLRVFQAVTVPPGRYRVEVTVVDLNSVRRGGRGVEVEGFAYLAGEAGVSGLELMEVPSPGEAGEAERHVREVLAAARTEETATEVGLYLETYNLPPEARMICRLTDEAGAAVRSWERPAPVGMRVPVRDTLDIAGLIEGDYRLQISVEGVGARPLVREHPLYIQRPLLVDGQDREATLEQAGLFAPPEVVERLGILEEEARVAFMDSLWRDLDPTPETARNEVREEFIRRLRYAEQEWTVGRRHGWRTDIGRIYVAYGEPDEVRDARTQRPALGPLDEPVEIRTQTWIYREPPAVFRFEFDRDRGWSLVREGGVPPPGVGRGAAAHIQPSERSGG